MEHTTSSPPVRSLLSSSLSSPPNTEIRLWAGCYFSAGDKERAQTLLDAVPGLMDKRKGPGGKELPTETFIKKKLIFYKQKQKAMGGDETKFVEAIRISPAEGAFDSLPSPLPIIFLNSAFVRPS